MSDSHDDVFHHVRDSQVFELPEFAYAIIPRAWTELPTLSLLGFEFPITKYMVLQVFAGLLVLFIFSGLAKRLKTGYTARGRFWGFWETVALFIRDEVVRTSIHAPHDEHDDHAHGDGGHGSGHDHAAGGHLGSPVSTQPVLAAAGSVPVNADFAYADRYLPFIWSIFFYILFCNLLGAIPFLGSATADMSLTGILALCVFATVLWTGIDRFGAVGFLKSMVPNIDMPGPGGMVVKLGVWAIEVVGLFVKHFVLAVRLFANMLAGHTVLYVFLLFISQSAHHGLIWYAVTPASIVAQVAISSLELLVAFIQAYVFALIASIAIGSAANPH